MEQKSDYQLNWITANRSSYSENQIKAALEELERRKIVQRSAKNITGIFRKLWDLLIKNKKKISS